MLRIVEEAARTDTGQQRHANEDAYFARAPAYAVADGMGGAQAGEVAAKIATDAFETDLADSGPPSQRLERVATEANRRIFELARSDASRSGMGTTLTAALLSDDEITIVHVGDSRAYLFRGGELRQLTRDHSLVEELRRQGRLTTEEAEDHPQRSIITRALGPEADVDLDLHTHQARSGDVFLLCSDGLTSMVKEERVHEILRGAESLRAAVDELVAEANRHGGRDNITAILFRLGSDDAESSAKRTELEDTRSDLAASEVAAALKGERRKPRRADGRRRTRPPVPVGPARRRRLKVVAAVAVVAVVLAGAVIGARAGLRSIYFVGQDDRGLVTLYQGLPYELPGFKLYRSRYVSSVKAARLRPFERRRLLDHELRSRGDAAALIRDLERRQ
jgi:PPM family protein phosphatase